eukprot:4142887-Pleurochrysis_carterae.AAC.1
MPTWSVYRIGAITCVSIVETLPSIVTDRVDIKERRKQHDSKQLAEAKPSCTRYESGSKPQDVIT